ncbi:hypothetical protein BQ8482_350206 [Mesorhizobium delmotii]|uniref:Uncharacterized protein n=1 Tax=Mesorhizobium delmotii TaxID=1631247 RepID=A0A2P9AR31_9HYPH|nr:hypothetical protein BQ8482_350206 [Mesorhizobium delmotii]
MAYRWVTFRIDFARQTFLFRICFLWLTDGSPSEGFAGVKIKDTTPRLIEPGFRKKLLPSPSESAVSLLGKKLDLARNQSATKRGL